MFTLILFSLCVGNLVSSMPQKIFYDIEKAETHFEDFLETYGKNYANATEKKMRFELFKKYLERINEFNEREKYATFGIYEYADLTQEEYGRQYAGAIPSSVGDNCQGRSPNITEGYTSPDRLDYREMGYVTGVKDQSTCGSCFAFSAVGVIEGQYAKRTGQALTFSEQQLLDCGTGSCSTGGDIGAALDTAKEGIEGSQVYPYEAIKGTCRFDPKNAIAKVLQRDSKSFSSEKEVEQYLASTGPLGFMLFAGYEFMSYTGGILQSCPAQGTLHALLLVGYDSENGIDYWIVKNSYGTAKGEQGYWRLKRNVNACGMMQHPFFTATV